MKKLLLSYLTASIGLALALGICAASLVSIDMVLYGHPMRPTAGGLALTLACYTTFRVLFAEAQDDQH